MKYLSIDIETTGLDPNQDQILEIASIYDDTENPLPIEQLPFFNVQIKYERIIGHPKALAMNAKLISEMDKGINITSAIVDFRDFINKHFLDGKANAAGKNFGSFDKLFLQRAWDAVLTIPMPFRHRCIDPTIFFAKSSDEVLPNLQECLKRAGCLKQVSHDALSDAIDIVNLTRVAFQLSKGGV